jgi:ubiquinone/menaquinone biosynthesis C-methylase UbiE
VCAEETVHHPLFARLYERISAQADSRGGAEHRRELLAGLAGRVIEVGAGNGRNFAHYPESVTEVVAVEPEARLRERALEAAPRAAVPISVVDGVAGSLPAEDGSFDVGVASLVLCTVPDVDAALSELRRVIKPAGELRFYEHVVSDRPRAARAQRILDATVWSRTAGGCHLARDTLAAIERAGFRIESSKRFGFSPSPLIPSFAHALGTAQRP